MNVTPGLPTDFENHTSKLSPERQNPSDRIRRGLPRFQTPYYRQEGRLKAKRKKHRFRESDTVQAVLGEAGGVGGVFW
jgi:hypothetical protein